MHFQIRTMLISGIRLCRSSQMKGTAAMIDEMLKIEVVILPQENMAWDSTGGVMMY